MTEYPMVNLLLYCAENNAITTTRVPDAMQSLVPVPTGVHLHCPLCDDTLKSDDGHIIKPNAKLLERLGFCFKPDEGTI